MTTNSNPNSDFNQNGPPPDRESSVIEPLWQEFCTLYPEDEDCFAELCKLINTNERLRCKKCDGSEIGIGSNMRVGKCISCNGQVWYTAGSFFEGIKKPKAWLGAIWLKGKGVNLSAGLLNRLTKVATSTAWTILKRLDLVVHAQLELEQNAHIVPSYMYASAICRRSLATPANQHPHSEEAEMNSREFETQMPPGAESDADGCYTGPSGTQQLSKLEMEVLEHLANGKLQFEEVCNLVQQPVGKVSATLAMLDMAGLIERLEGDFYHLAPKPFDRPDLSNSDQPNPEVVASIIATIAYIRSGFHGVSRKYLQLFLASHWCFANRLRWSPESLLKACSQFPPIKNERIRQFVSPLRVRVYPTLEGQLTSA
jgi:hypothetical protein